MLQLTGTVGLKVPVLQLAQANLLNSPCRTYLYTFDYRGAFTRYYKLNSTLNLQ